MSAAIEKAWSAWTKGDVLDAKNLATGLSATAEGQHLLFLCAFVEGNYEEALLHYPAIPASYTRYGELDGPVIQAYVHLSRYAEAERFARGRKVNEILLNTKKKLRILAKPATDSDLIRPPVGAKRRWSFIICPCGRNESRIFAFSWILP